MIRPHHKLRVHRSLPPLSRLADLHPGCVCIDAGAGVQTGETSAGLHLVEGAWDGPSNEFGFAAATNFFGSGLSLVDGRAVLAAPTHTLETPYLCKVEDHIIASNSLIFLLTHQDIKFSLVSDIWKSVLTMSKGKLNQGRVLYEDEQRRVRRYIACNLEVVGGKTKVTEKAEPPHSGTYAEYIEFMNSTCGNVLGNAADKARTRTYTPLASASKGYDSSACAAIMAANGCGETITIADSRRSEWDSGRNIAEAPSMHCTELSRPDPSRWRNAEAAEFVASGCGGGSVCLAMEKELPGRVLGTGYLGDVLRAPKDAPPNILLARRSTGGIGLGEFRFRTDFIHAPFCFDAGTRNEDLYRIGQTENTQPYWIPEYSDRPIARRVLEFASVTQAAFRRMKQAILFMMAALKKPNPRSHQRAGDELMRGGQRAMKLMGSRLYDPTRTAQTSIWKFLGGATEIQRSIFSKIRFSGRMFSLHHSPMHKGSLLSSIDETAPLSVSVKRFLECGEIINHTLFNARECISKPSRLGATIA